MSGDVPLWVGRARPIQDSEPARLYWTSDIPVREILARFPAGVAATKYAKVVGPADIGLNCVDCGKAHAATSRSDAQSALQSHSSDIRYRGGSQHRCVDCFQVHKENKFREGIRKQREKQERAEELRWMPYPEYLGTSEWAVRRRDVIRKARFMCQVCAAGGKLHVHHRTYARRGSERAEDMIALCADCHQLFHDHGKLAAGGRAA